MGILSGALLAGGASRRFGSPKALAQFKGRPLYKISLDSLKEYCDTIYISANNRELYEQEPFEIVEDQIKNQGPLRGILSVLEKTDHALLLVLTCDMPLLQKEYIGLLADKIHLNKKIICFQIEDQLHPFPGIYRRDLVRDLKRQLSREKYSVRAFINSLPRQDKEIICLKGCLKKEKISFSNINTKKELAAL